MSEEKDISVHAFVIPVTPFQQNCSILWCTETKRGAVIDPGGDIDQIISAIKKYDVEIEKILITHAHLDPRRRNCGTFTSAKHTHRRTS